MMELSKEEFVKIMEWLRSKREREEALAKAFEAYDKEARLYLGAEWETKLIRLLELIMDDVSADGWISYWIYDLNYGADAKVDTVRDSDGKNIPIKTAEDLYDLLNPPKVV